jgi:hypothetical protein
MKSAAAAILWIALVGLGAIGLADALQSILLVRVHLAGLIVYALVMAALPTYPFIRHQRVHWPTLYTAVAGVDVFAGSLLLARPDSISEGSAFLAMGISIFVAVFVRGFRRA